MKWDSRLAAIRIPSNETFVHIVDRSSIDKPRAILRYSNINTYCGLSVTDQYVECSEEQIDCETCVTTLEKQQKYWDEFWSSPEGRGVMKILTGVNMQYYLFFFSHGWRVEVCFLGDKTHCSSWISSNQGLSQTLHNLRNASS